MMPPKQPTFVDASVLINAIVGQDAARKMRALSVLADPDREFVATEFLKLEVLPFRQDTTGKGNGLFMRDILKA
jgi:hypothetical protein